MNNDDKRVRKTKKALQIALVELLSEKDLDKISVKEITEKADVHRVTFYSHYQDIYELYAELENDSLSGITDFIGTDPSHSYEDMFIHVVDYIYENRWICPLLFKNPSLLDKVLDMLEEQYLEIWKFEDHTDVVTSDMRYLTAYNISGCQAIIRHWWRNGFSEPKENVITYLRRANRIFDAVSLIK